MAENVLENILISPQCDGYDVVKLDWKVKTSFRPSFLTGTWT